MTNGNPVGEFETGDGLNARILALSTRAESVLNANPRTRGLLATLPRTDASPLRIALLGPYSSGKSMLIAALLRLPSAAVDELTGAAPKTHEPKTYSWNGVTLVDLPGTLSGNDEHSGAARRGVRGSDVLMIVTTSELPGEAETKTILQTLDTDGFADRSVVVVNKMNSENSDPDVILDEIRKRLGPFADRVPIVPTDARDYVDAINDPSFTDSQRDLLIAESGVDVLKDELLRIIEPGVSKVRPLAQAYELLRVLADAGQQWVLDGEELSAAENAKKVEESISQAKGSVLSTLGRESDVVASVIKAAGSKIVHSVSDKDGDVPVDVRRDVDRKRMRAIARFDAKFYTSMRAEFDVLVAEHGTGVPEPEAWENDLDSPVATIDSSPDDESRLQRGGREAAKAGARGMREWIEKVANSGSEQGSVASNIATRINKSRAGQKLLDVGEKVSNGAGKFRPWGRGKAADKIANMAAKTQWALMVIGPLIDLTGVVEDHVKRVKIDRYREQIRSQFHEDALKTRSALADSGTQWLSEWIVKVEQSLSGLSNQGAAISTLRETALGEIGSLRDEAEKLLQVALCSRSES